MGLFGRKKQKNEQSNKNTTENNVAAEENLEQEIEETEQVGKKYSEENAKRVDSIEQENAQIDQSLANYYAGMAEIQDEAAKRESVRIARNLEYWHKKVAEEKERAARLEEIHNKREASKAKQDSLSESGETKSVPQTTSNYKQAENKTEEKPSRFRGEEFKKLTNEELEKLTDEELEEYLRIQEERMDSWYKDWAKKTIEEAIKGTEWEVTSTSQTSSQSSSTTDPYTIKPTAQSSTDAGYSKNISTTKKEDLKLPPEEEEALEKLIKDDIEMMEELERDQIEREKKIERDVMKATEKKPLFVNNQPYFFYDELKKKGYNELMETLTESKPEEKSSGFRR